MQTALSEHQPLKHEVSRHKFFMERLLATYPEHSEDDLADTLEGLTDLNEMIAAVIRSALVDEALQQGLKVRMSEMKERMARLVHRSAKKRQIALEAMSEAKLKKLEQSDFTASARSGVPALVVHSEDEIPEEYWLPQPPKLDRQLLLADLKRGEEIDGTDICDPKTTLSVRTK